MQCSHVLLSCIFEETTLKIFSQEKSAWSFTFLIPSFFLTAEFAKIQPKTHPEGIFCIEHFLGTIHITVEIYLH